jgi:Cyclin, N-terminal domain
MWTNVVVVWGLFPSKTQETPHNPQKSGRKEKQDLVKMVELVERMEIMFQQEEKSYKTVDYLAPEFQKQLASICDMNLIEPTVSPKSSNGSLSSNSTSGINDIWREKICEWSYQVIDHFDFQRQVVSVSIHYLDRFLATRPCSKKVFQLAAMTTLFLAIKLYEPGRLSMQSMIELSRGYFQVEQMVAMEMAILRYVAAMVHGTSHEKPKQFRSLPSCVHRPRHLAVLSRI